MNFLELVAKTWLKCGLTGSAPVAVVDQRDMAGRVVGFVQDAYSYIQSIHPCWNFHYLTAEGTLVTGVSLYRPADLNAENFRIPHRVLLQRDGQWFPITIGKDVDSDEYENLAEGEPDKIAFLRNGTWLLNRIPVANQPIRIHYYRNSHQLTDATDNTLIPSDFEMVIVFKAMEAYAYFDSDASLLQEAQREYSKLLSRLERQELPPVKFMAGGLL